MAGVAHPPAFSCTQVPASEVLIGRPVLVDPGLTGMGLLKVQAHLCLLLITTLLLHADHRPSHQS